MNREEWWNSGFAPPRKVYGPVSRSTGFDNALGTTLKVIGIILILPFYLMAMVIKSIRINI